MSAGRTATGEPAEATVLPPQQTYGQFQFDWGGCYAGEFTATELLGAARPLSEHNSCRVVCQAVHEEVAEAMAEDEARLIPILGYQAKLHDTLSKIDWRDMAEHEVVQWCMAMEQMAHHTGRRLATTTQELFLARGKIHITRDELEAKMEAREQEEVRRRIMNLEPAPPQPSPTGFHGSRGSPTQPPPSAQASGPPNAQPTPESLTQGAQPARPTDDSMTLSYREDQHSEEGNQSDVTMASSDERHAAPHETPKAWMKVTTKQMDTTNWFATQASSFLTPT